MSEASPRIAPLAPPYPPEIQAQFDRVMRGAPPLVLFRVIAGHSRAFLHPGQHVFFKAVHGSYCPRQRREKPAG